jgi:hypothetical protein
VSVRLRARVRNDLAPASGVGLHVVAELRGRHARRNHALFREGIDHAGILDGLRDGVGQLRDDILRRRGGNEHPYQNCGS